ncbi:MAG: hypothetical protein DMG08_04605 [Acidobacteria bacterium]|nr:MAG: hypothetical protein DMG08_04605 [Acidobacteriota bacterium]
MIIRTLRPALISFLLLVMGLTGSSQEASSEKVSVAFSDPARPGLLKAGLITGGISVTGYDGKDVVIEARARQGRLSRRERSGEGMEGMTRLQNLSSGLTVEEENNVMTVHVGVMNREIDLNIQVPFKTSLKLSSVNDGDIKVQRVQGEIEVNNVNGGITLTNISGSAVAGTTNGDVVATFDAATPGKSMSFSSFNGKIDVTFPPEMKANVVMKSEEGDIYSDFDIRMDSASRAPIVEDSRSKGGKYRIRLEKSLYGTINGGGPEMHLKNFNGDIYIRKKK